MKNPVSWMMFSIPYHIHKPNSNLPIENFRSPYNGLWGKQSWDKNTSTSRLPVPMLKTLWHYDKPASVRPRTTTSTIVPGRDEEPKTVWGIIVQGFPLFFASLTCWQEQFITVLGASWCSQCARIWPENNIQWYILKVRISLRLRAPIDDSDHTLIVVYLIPVKSWNQRVARSVLFSSSTSV